MPSSHTPHWLHSLPLLLRSLMVSLVGGVLLVAGLLVVHRSFENMLIYPTDFTQDYAAAMALRTGQPLYTHFTESELQHLLPGYEQIRSTGQGKMSFHPPSTALFFVPLTLLPYQAAAFGWGILLLLLTFASVWIIVREMRLQLPIPRWIVLVGLILCWYPVVLNIAFGQLSLILTACLVGSWWLLRQQREIGAGVLIGLATLIKLFPGLLFLYLLLRGRWRSFVAGSATMGVGGLLLLATVGGGDILHYVTTIAPLNVERYGAYPMNASITGAIHRLFETNPFVEPLATAPQVGALLIGFISAGVLLVLLVCLWHGPPTPQKDDRTFALFCVAMLLLSPITWNHAFPILMIPLGLLLRDIQQQPSRTRILLFIVLLMSFSLPDIQIARYLLHLHAPDLISWFAGLVFLVPTGGLLLCWLMLCSQWQNGVLHQKPGAEPQDCYSQNGEIRQDGPHV